jgi:FeS assembly protein IscX
MTLNWESTYAIALALKTQYPNMNMDNVSLNQILEWTVALAEFEDDPSLVNDGILAEIYQTWFEEILNDKQ